MTIRKKIWVIYILSIIVPVVILMGSMYYFTTSVRTHVDREIDNIRENYTHDPINNMIQSIQNEITNNPEILDDTSYEDVLTPIIQMTPFEIKIYKRETLALTIEQRKFRENDPLFIIRSGRFKDKADTPYRYEVLVRDKDPKNSFVTRFNRTLVKNGFLFLMVYGILHLLFFKYSIRTIFAPLNHMKEAAIRIRDENYDDNLDYEGNDEIGEVFQSFEEMRLRIKESHQVQRQYENNRKELIANISHDLKTPITAINGYVQGIIDGVANTDEKLHAYIQTIAMYSKDMDTLIDDLSLMSTLDIDGILFSFEALSIKDYLGDCIEELSFDLEENGIQIESHYEIEANVVVEIDAQQIKRVINNVVFNAMKHFDKAEAHLTIRVKESEEMCTISISDNGKGIDTENLETIFERFYRVDESRTSETGGSGLGLSIAKQIIIAHGGEIWAESEKGIGTTITFSLKKVTEV